MLYKKIAALFILAVIISVPAHAGKISIPAGTEIQVIFDPNIDLTSNRVEEGVPVLINLYKPIEIGGVTIVEKGAPGTARVVEVKKNGRVGKPGYIKVEFESLGPKGAFVPVEEGQKIKLEGSVENKGGGKKLLSIILGFGLIIKGGQGKIDTSVPYTAKTAETIILEN